MKFLFVLFILMLFIININVANGLPPPPLTSFSVHLVDESNQEIEIPAHLEIEEILDGKSIQSYKIDLFKNPKTISLAWYVPNKAENTEIHIVAVKQGYVSSDEFVFTITTQTPTEGKLFDHTFVLKTEETSKVSDKSFKVTSEGKSHTIATKSSSSIHHIEFLEDENSVLMVLNEDALSGFTDLSIPTSLISPPFTILVDDVTVFPTEEKIGQSTILHLEYTNGVHTIRVISPVDTTVPQTGQGIESEFEQQVEKPTGEVPVSQPGQEQGGGCLIATATYGSELAPQVQMLREIRDNSLLQTESGSAFMESFNQFYYSFSPGIADLERENPVFKETIKIAITPLISSLSILNYVDIDSEAEVLGYGISLILLNVGMYFVTPAMIILAIYRKHKPQSMI